MGLALVEGLLAAAGARLVPDCLMRAPSVERGGGKNGWADGLTGGAQRAGLGPPTKNIRRAAPRAGLDRFHSRAGTDRGRPLRRTPQALGVVGPRTASKGKWRKFAQFFHSGGSGRAAAGEVYPRACGGTIPHHRLITPTSGLSPRLRGNRVPSVMRGGNVRSVPAPAGEPSRNPEFLRRSKVCPRACGGTAASRTVAY